MTEDFLHFLWKFQRFDLLHLTTTAGESLQIVAIGQHNHHAGPDFQNARLVIGGISWAGHVEMHLKASDWHRHRHSEDPAYENVILHVVWENDTEIIRSDGTPIPALEMKQLLEPPLLNYYTVLLQNPATIACAHSFGEVSDITRLGMIHRAATHRLERKAALVRQMYEHNNHDWEETAYQLLAQNFGFKVNAEPMLRLAKGLPFKVLQKHRNNLFQLEALLLGQSGLEADEVDEYVMALQREYKFLANKYNVTSQQLRPQEWKFMRLRPANFPTLRLAQLAALIAQNGSLFSMLVHTESPSHFAQCLRVKTSDYWQRHYVLGKEAIQKVSSLGKSSIENIIINTVAPLLAAYAAHQDQSSYLDKAVNWLEQLAPEQNHITEEWATLGLSVRNAYESQGSIELFNEYCTPKKCLECSIGVSLLRR